MGQAALARVRERWPNGPLCPCRHRAPTRPSAGLCPAAESGEANLGLRGTRLLVRAQPPRLKRACESGAPEAPARKRWKRAAAVPRPLEEVPQQSLRISASRAAAAAGIHPFADVGELFLELLYQDLPELLLHDAQIVGADVVGPLQAREELLTKSGEMPSFEEALQGAQAAESVQAIWEAQRLVREASAAAEKSGRLSAAEAEELQKGLEAELNQGFGSKHESSALTRYAQQQGCQVHSCGMRLCLAMPEAGPAEALASALPAMSGSMADRAQQAAEESGYFLLSGYVDALAEVPGPEGPETVVVEVKHPIGRIKVPPNIYDVVQLGTYCRVLGLRQGHLVQCLRQEGGEGRLHITRLDFSEGQAHRKGWDASVLPSMYKLVAAVYAARQDAALRQRLLASSPQERTSLVEAICPHLER